MIKQLYAYYIRFVDRRHLKMMEEEELFMYDYDMPMEDVE